MGNRPYEEFRNPALRRERIAREEKARQEKAEIQRNKDEHKNFISHVELASKHHPEINQQVFRDIIKAYEAEIGEHITKQKEIREEGGMKGNYRIELQEQRDSFMTKIQDRLKTHGSAATAALQAVAVENQPESMFTPLVRMFYNSDRGGPQWGPALSALLGGGLAYYYGSSTGASPLYTLALTGAVALVGAYINNKIMPHEETTPTPNFRTPAPAKSKAKSPEAAVSEQEKQKTQDTALLSREAPLEGVKQEPIKDPTSAPYTPPTNAPSPEAALPIR